MKKIISLAVVLVCGVIVTGCVSNGEVDTEKSSDNSKSIASEVTSESSTVASTSEQKSTSTSDKAESTEIVAKGEYEVGTDIQPGSYYAVLTEFEYYDDSYKENNLGYVSIAQTTPSEVKIDESSEIKESGNTSTDRNYKLESVGAKQRVKLKDGDILNFGDNYDPKYWTVKLLNDDDFKKYMEENK